MTVGVQFVLCQRTETVVSLDSWQGQNQEDCLRQCANYLISSGGPCAIPMNSCANCKLTPRFTWQYIPSTCHYKTETTLSDVCMLYEYVHTV